MTFLLQHLNYIAVIVVMMLGLFVTFSSGNLIKRMIGLAIFQTSTGLLFISLGKVEGGTAAITLDPSSPEAKLLATHVDPATLAQAGVNGVVYSNPLPHVLILTAIVVGVSTLAVGLAIAVRIREAYGSVEASDIAAKDRAPPPESRMAEPHR
jgi:multicomponent Na+:H+ antiporter subunit C